MKNKRLFYGRKKTRVDWVQVHSNWVWNMVEREWVEFVEMSWRECVSHIHTGEASSGFARKMHSKFNCQQTVRETEEFTSSWTERQSSVSIESSLVCTAWTTVIFHGKKISKRYSFWFQRKQEKRNEERHVIILFLVSHNSVDSWEVTHTIDTTESFANESLIRQACSCLLIHSQIVSSLAHSLGSSLSLSLSLFDLEGAEEWSFEIKVPLKDKMPRSSSLTYSPGSSNDGASYHVRI
jgi:hypothetical protein